MVTDPPLPIPNNVVVFELPTRLQFLMVLLVAPSDPFDCSQMTADVVLVFVFVIVRSLVATEEGQFVLADDPSDPSIITLSDAFNRMIAFADEPVML